MSGRRFLIGLILLYSALRLPHSAFGQEVQWRYDYGKARREAETKSLPLVIDIGTENCYWCKQLDARTFRDPAGLLEGEGKTGRHLKLRAAADLPRDVVRGWLRAAAEVARTKAARS